MNKLVVTVFTAGAITAGSAFAGSNAPALPGAPRPAALAKQKPMDETHEARRVVAQAADKALDSATALLDMVTKADRDRVSNGLTKTEQSKFKEVGDKFQAEWKKKYGENFRAEAHPDELGGLKPKMEGDGKDQVAVISLPGSEGEGRYQLRLKREPNGWWRINLPDTETNANFEKDLMDSIDRATGQVSKLPDDKAQAYQSAVTMLLHEMAFPENASK
jgi:hypothetical protein